MIDFYFDCSSPWSYLAFRNIQPLARELGVAITWKPVLVGGIFNTVNQGIYATRESWDTPKMRYARKDVHDCAQEAGLSIHFPPSVFPVNSVKAMRGCLWLAQDAATQPQFLAFAEAAFKAYFQDDRDISQDAVLADLCQQLGIDAEAFAQGIAQADIKDQLKHNTSEAIQRGAFGVPTVFVGDDMYFGNDRLHLVRSAVLRARTS